MYLLLTELTLSTGNQCTTVVHEHALSVHRYWWTFRKIHVPSNTERRPGTFVLWFSFNKCSQTLPNQTAHYYQQFALSLAKESPHSFSKFKPLIMDTPLIRTLYALLHVLIKGIWQYSIWIVPWVVWANGCRDDTWTVVGTKCPFICWHPFPPLWSSVIQSHTHLDTSVEDK